jgi:two-component system LytT family sensor kinase
MIYVQLLESMSLIALSAYVYNQIHLSKSLIKEDLKFTDKLILIVFFGVLGIIGNYTAVNVGTKNINHNIGFHDAIANTRPIAAIIAGYIGGPVVGVVVGLVAGVNRYFLGGFTALACAIATVAEGLIGSITRKISIDDDYNLKKVFTGAIIAEMVKM